MKFAYIAIYQISVCETYTQSHTHTQYICDNDTHIPYKLFLVWQNPIAPVQGLVDESPQRVKVTFHFKLMSINSFYSMFVVKCDLFECDSCLVWYSLKLWSVYMCWRWCVLWFCWSSELVLLFSFAIAGRPLAVHEGSAAQSPHSVVHGVCKGLTCFNFGHKAQTLLQVTADAVEAPAEFGVTAVLVGSTGFVANI